jgi:predicted nucleic acid-binding Zn ribbon protein
MIYCTKCGAPRPADVNYCRKCGEYRTTNHRSRRTILIAVFVLVGFGVFGALLSQNSGSPNNPEVAAPAPAEAPAINCNDLARFAEYAVGYRANTTEDSTLSIAEQSTPESIRPYALRMTRIIWNSTLTMNEASSAIGHGCAVNGADGAIAALKEAADASNAAD